MRLAWHASRMGMKRDAYRKAGKEETTRKT
jgi:hypothetical protein